MEFSRSAMALAHNQPPPLAHRACPAPSVWNVTPWKAGECGRRDFPGCERTPRRGWCGTKPRSFLPYPRGTTAPGTFCPLRAAVAVAMATGPAARGPRRRRELRWRPQPGAPRPAWAWGGAGAAVNRFCGEKVRGGRWWSAGGVYAALTRMAAREPAHPTRPGPWCLPVRPGASLSVYPDSDFMPCFLYSVFSGAG